MGCCSTSFIAAHSSKNSRCFKVIPMFCTAHPPLRITLPHPRWRRFFTLARKEKTRAAFAELKLLFAIIMPQIELELCGIIKMSWLRLWIMGGCEACGTALRLSNCINEPVSGLGSLLYICCSNSENGETNISGTNKTHRSTRTTRGRPVNTRSAAKFPFCCV